MGAWWNVKASTISNCWRKAGLIKAPAQLEDNLEEDHSNPGDLWNEVEELLPHILSFDDYIESDSAALTSKDMTAKEIVKSVQDVSSVDDDLKEEDSEEDESILQSDALGISFADYVEVDTCASVCGALTGEDIIAQVAGAQPVAEEPEGEEDDDDEVPVRPSASEVMETLNVTRLFFSFEEGEEDSLRRIRAL
ncbi:hypothetical protein HPB50_010237 [Hyalomma asiaticum]|uniref:Uncharacterized protein n=1 Tax=Hyalomma asiaticum TaxID=266040 RepID=A0ACB7SDP2_HYAAI|nr:hypothetical protein HPB50_010237 [Hyalomma asiaticum]